ncbi:hypothetical protein DAI22_11g097066 [Oryza sativa Japonica Group]|nr:hypothetical protein DAI22_11g097066 [Oryza sativa Japonica Group]
MASVENAKSVGISNKATIDLMAKEAGGYENLGFTREDMKNRLYSKRSLKVNEVFGDVLCFDTTYRKLNDGRPFGLLVGVDNHKKSVVFGAALLYDETADSFVWLFKTFLKAMSGKKPQTILTGEDAAMAKAIKLVMPESHHRICVWHMNQNACKHLAGVVKEYKKFNADFQNCIYDKEEEDEFINAWNRMLEKNTFSADMSGTQRSESMNNELKGYISVKYDILTFLEHFDRLLSDKRYEEVKNDFKTTQSTPWPKADLTILRQATRIYTPAIFKVFQEQVLQTLNCDLYYCGDIDAKMVYKLKVHSKHHEHIVKFSPTEDKVRCSCKKFEFLGILCCHALKILDVNNIKEIPKQYILQRWTIDAKSLHIKSNCSTQEDPKIKLSTRRRDLCRMFVKIASRATESDETYLMAANNAQNIRPDQDLDKSGLYHTLN